MKVTIAVLLCVIAALAYAQQRPTPAGSPNRFMIATTTTPTVAWRIDGLTGAVTYCYASPAGADAKVRCTELVH